MSRLVMVDDEGKEDERVMNIRPLAGNSTRFKVSESIQIFLAIFERSLNLNPTLDNLVNSRSCTTTSSMSVTMSTIPPLVPSQVTLKWGSALLSAVNLLG